jgi:crotonobetainyl-CoA:carnitine CoA-transferase CaiB-like acyl-CoA transferase
MMDANKQWESPPVTFLADLVSGAYLALGIMMALFYREKSGIGQMVDVSMQDVMYASNMAAMRTVQ